MEMTETAKVVAIKEISEDIIRLTVRDQNDKHQTEQEKAVELLARAICDFSVMCLSSQSDDEELLKGTLAKVQIAYNTINKAKKTMIVAAEI